MLKTSRIFCFGVSVSFWGCSDFYGPRCAHTPVLVEMFWFFLCFLVFARLLLFASVGLHGHGDVGVSSLNFGVRGFFLGVWR